MIFIIYSSAPAIPHYTLPISQILNPNFTFPIDRRISQSFLGLHLIGKKYTQTPFTELEMNTYKQFKDFSPIFFNFFGYKVPFTEMFGTIDQHNRMTIFFNPLHRPPNHPCSFKYSLELKGLVYERIKRIDPECRWVKGKGPEILSPSKELYDAKLRRHYESESSFFMTHGTKWIEAMQKQYHISNQDIDLTLVGFGRMAGLAEMGAYQLKSDRFSGKLCVIACNSPYIFENDKGLKQIYKAFQLGENYFPIKVHTPTVVEKTYKIRPEKWWQRRGLGLPEPVFEVTIPDMTSSWCAPIIYPRMYPWHYLPPFYKWWYRNHPIMVV